MKKEMKTLGEDKKCCGKKTLLLKSSAPGCPALSYFCNECARSYDFETGREIEFEPDIEWMDETRRMQAKLLQIKEDLIELLKTFLGEDVFQDFVHYVESKMNEGWSAIRIFESKMDEGWNNIEEAKRWHISSTTIDVLMNQIRLQRFREDREKRQEDKEDDK